MTNETKILTALLDPNGTEHYLMHLTVGRNITIRHNGLDNVIIIEHGDKRMMVAMGKEDSSDRLVPLMKKKKGVQEFDTYREPLTPTKGGEDGKGIPSVFGHKIMERQSPMVLRPVDTLRYRMFDHDDIVIPEINDADTLDCGCIDRDQEKVGCESCHRISCLDCHEIDSTPVKVADWKCKEGFGCSMEEEE